MHSIDAAYCYTRRYVVCLSVADIGEPCKTAESIHDAVLHVGLSRPKYPCITRGSGSPPGKEVILVWGRDWPMYNTGTMERKPCKDGWLDRDGVWHVKM